MPSAQPRSLVVSHDGWLALETCADRVPVTLLPWLAEPGLLTARVRAVGGDSIQFSMLRLERAPLEPELQERLRVADTRGLVREIEFASRGERWIFAQSAFPESTVERHPWLAGLGASPIGEVLRRVGAEVVREPLEYRELPRDHPLFLAARPAGAGPVWARRAVYRIAGAPIIVQEVFLPALAGRDPGLEESR
jgi:chorismate--pyruvate lyase